jgi:hypothetical protein
MLTQAHWQHGVLRAGVNTQQRQHPDHATSHTEPWHGTYSSLSPSQCSHPASLWFAFMQQ